LEKDDQYNIPGHTHGYQEQDAKIDQKTIDNRSSDGVGIGPTADPAWHAICSNTSREMTTHVMERARPALVNISSAFAAVLSGSRFRFLGFPL